MQISNIFTQLQDAKTWGKAGQSSGAAASRALDALTSRSGSSTESSSAVGQILAEYDVSSITPGEFSEMIGKLRGTEALSESDLGELAQIRSDLDASGIRADEKVNLLTYYQKRLEKLQSGTQDSMAKQSAANIEQRLEWVQKLSTMHEASDSLGIDALV